MEERTLKVHARQVEAFRAIMVTGSVSAAAAHMHITQPAVSRLLRDMETEIGFTLFVRDGNRLVPRDEALILFREVERVFVGLDHIGRVAQDIRAVKGGVIRVGTVTSLNRLCMREALIPFLERYPSVTVIFDTENTERVLDLTAIQHYDLGLVYHQEDRAGLPGEVIGRSQAVAVVPHEHPLSRKDEIALSDLSAYRVILPGRRAPLRLALNSALSEKGIDLRTPIEASLANCCAMTAYGIGISVVDPLIAADYSDQLVVKPLQARIGLSYQIVRPPQAAQGQLTDAFSHLIKRAVQDRLRARPAQ
tara:strand:+ start:1032 stop:1952 length:921 start_codon:yes stop_codon:yes gene_type:complete